MSSGSSVATAAAARSSPVIAANRALAKARLRALARACAEVEPTDFDDAVDAAFVGERGFFYTEADGRAVGGALRWATSRGLNRIDVFTPDGASELARRSSLLGPGEPTIAVWHVAGSDVAEAVPGPAAEAPEIPDDHWALAALMTEAGALPVDDHGVLVAEVAGLEVARVVDGEDGPVIDVGVGQADRELNQMIHRDADPVSDLRRVIAAVNENRLRHDHHPLQRLGRERWLRSLLLDDPTLVGALDLTPLVPLRPRAGLLEPAPSAAAGSTVDGRPLVAVTMVGIDLDLLCEAADYRYRHDPEAELVIAMPERDLALSTVGIERLARTRTQPLEGPWPPLQQTTRAR